MSFALAGKARAELDRYMARQAQLNHVSVGALEKRFAVDPTVQQRLKNAQMLSSDLLQKINVIGVKEQEGEKVLIGTTGPIARTNSTSDGSHRRNPATVHDLEARRYRCDQVNYDTAIGYPQLDAWAGHDDFQSRIGQQIGRQVALDRIMIGFNGTSHALVSDFAKNPLLQDILPGWLAQIRQKAPQRVMSDVTISTRDIAKKLNYGYTDFMSYSIDFRRRILSIKKHEGLSICETAKRFHIGTTTIVRWTKQIDARPATSRQRKIDKSALERDVEQYPDAYQRERAERFGVCQMAICKALKKLQLTYKKNSASSKSRRRR